MKLLIALGGNALSNKSSKKETILNLKKISPILADLIKNNKVVITHGSGPQAGALMLQNRLSSKKIPEMPLDVIDAEVQGQLGYLIEQVLINELNKKRIKKSVITVLTQVLVDKNDKAFRNPSKFVGPYYKKKPKGNYKKDSMGYRKVVPSPYPREILESKVIKNLFNKNIVVIAAGGGGIPVYNKNGLKGVEGVIDKDLASSILADKINVHTFIILTNVSNVFLNFKKKNQKALRKAKLKDIKKYLKEGHFLEGSMKPKIQAAIKFLELGGKKVIITDSKNISKALKGSRGTIIEK